jgi:hypothetical protein
MVRGTRPVIGVADLGHPDLQFRIPPMECGNLLIVLYPYP